MRHLSISWLGSETTSSSRGASATHRCQADRRLPLIGSASRVAGLPVLSRPRAKKARSPAPPVVTGAVRSTR